MRAADGTGTPERLSTGTHLPTSWSRDGRFIVFSDFGAQSFSATGPADLALLSLADRRTTPLLSSPACEALARVSPDSRWLAYESGEAGDIGVFVRPFPDAGSGRWRISPGIGAKPEWSVDGTTLFYSSGQAMFAVDVRGANPDAWGAPRKVFGARAELVDRADGARSDALMYNVHP